MLLVVKIAILASLLLIAVIVYSKMDSQTTSFLVVSHIVNTRGENLGYSPAPTRNTS